MGVTRVLGRTDERGEAGELGCYRARDGSDGAEVRVDLDGPHVAIVVGKRGYGKSYTLGVLAEELGGAENVTPVVADPMGAFTTFEAVSGFDVVGRPRVAANTLPPRAWCDLLGLDAEGPVGALVWRAATAGETLGGMREYASGADAPKATRRAARNHLSLAESWDVFDPGGLTAGDCTRGSGTILDLSGYDDAAMNAVVRAVANALYYARVSGAEGTMPWLLVDEAHAFFDGVAAPALRRIVTRGRRPGVSLVAATQRPSALPEVAVSQADLLVAHRLTARADREALSRARPTYMRESFADRMPESPGAAVVVDDATESVHVLRVRERNVSHGGGSPRASELRKG